MRCLRSSRLCDCSFQGHGSYDERTEEANIVTPFLGYAPEIVKILSRPHLSRSKEAWKRVQQESFAIVMHKVIGFRGVSRRQSYAIFIITILQYMF